MKVFIMIMGIAALMTGITTGAMAQKRIGERRTISNHEDSDSDI